jgi:hypothetical protein
MSSGGSSGGSGGFEPLAMMVVVVVVVARASFEDRRSSFVPRDMAMYEMESRSFSYDVSDRWGCGVCTCVNKGFGEMVW